ncbi:hypothetical protein HT031_001285 [Scenedesmus sp. PABB004]|nr:hypothetical protein HT031_001285 [Scenedesmus sp. PABB004]
MKFRATLTLQGCHSLCRAFLPTLDKFGKSAHVLIGPEEVHFVQTPLEADGASVTVRFAVVRPHARRQRAHMRVEPPAAAGGAAPHARPARHAAHRSQDKLFVREAFKVSSRHFNLIAFAVDVGLLLKALRSALANDADSVDVRLTQKAVQLPGSSDTENRPFLCFTARVSRRAAAPAPACTAPWHPRARAHPRACRRAVAAPPQGAALSLLQDMPVGKPCTASEIDALVAAKDVSALSPFYLDLASAGARLPAVVDKLRALSAVMQAAVCKARRGAAPAARPALRRRAPARPRAHSPRRGAPGLAQSGDFHAQVAEGVMLGAAFSGLAVYPADARSEPDNADGQLTAEQKLQAALDAGDAMAVHVQVKHLLKVLNVSHLSQPAQVLFGIAEGCGHVHVMYVYRDPSGDAAYDDSLSLAFKLPVREED